MVIGKLIHVKNCIKIFLKLPIINITLEAYKILTMCFLLLVKKLGHVTLDNSIKIQHQSSQI